MIMHLCLNQFKQTYAFIPTRDSNLSYMNNLKEKKYRSKTHVEIVIRLIECRVMS